MARAASILVALIWVSAPTQAVATLQQQTAAADSGAGYVHEVWTVRDGLPVNSINALIQSRSGYIWAATYDGLVRFDGIRFTVYNAGNSEGLPSNRIIDLMEARDGSLWLRTEQHHLVQLRAGRFTHFDASLGLTADVNEVYEDSQARLWVGTTRGAGQIRDGRFQAVDGIAAGVVTVLERRAGSLLLGTEGAGLYEVVGTRATPFAPAAELRRDSITALYEDAERTLWISTSRGLYRYRTGLQRVSAGLLPGGVHAITGARSGTIWLLGPLGMYRLDGERAVHTNREMRYLVRRRLLQSDTAGAVWYGSGTGLYRDGVRMYALGPPPSEELAALAPTEISALLFDREGSIWLGTHASGLHRLKPSAFTVYSKPEGLAERNTYPVVEDRAGNIWLGTLGGGLARITSSGVRNFGTGHRVPLLISSLLADRAGRLWVGSHPAGSLVVCSLPEPSCTPLDLPPLHGATILALHEDRSGSIWVGTDLGLFRLQEGVAESFAATEEAPTAPVRVFLETADGGLWMGTNGGGLARYQSGRFSTVSSAHGLPSNLIRSLHQDAEGWLWVGTEGRGLVRLDPRPWAGATPPEAGSRPALSSYRASDGLFDEVIHQILADDAGRLWMSTNRGIFWVRRAELNAFAAGTAGKINSTVYTERDGLRNREANGGSHPAGVRSRDGRLWFPTQEGVAVVDPRQIRHNPVPPPVVIEQVTSRGARAPLRGGTVQLGVRQRDLEIEYTALSLLAPENVRFRYRLEGYDSDWIDAGARRTAYYTRVPPGGYTFRLIASNDAGVWNEAGATLELWLAPAFYETGAFRVLLVLALAVATVLALGWRVRLVRLQAQRLARLVDERTLQLRERERQLELQNAQLETQAGKLAELDQAKSRFFANVSHEFRTPLALTIGPLEDLRARFATVADDDAPRKLDLALRNARRLLRLVNQVLDVARLEAGHMRLDLRLVDLVTVVRGIAATFTQLAERKRIALDVTSAEAAIPVRLDADALEKVFTNLLSNAFRFTPEGGTIEIAIERGGEAEAHDRALVRITDSGPGIRPQDLPHVFERFYHVDESDSGAQPGIGIGLSLARELVELQGGSIHAASAEGAGATFTVVLPLAATEQAGARAGRPAERRPGDEPGLVHESFDRPAEPEPPAGPNEADVPTVLVIDDNSDLRAYVRNHLSPPWRVLEAADGAQGLTLARTFLPDLAISDVMMPVLDGQQLCAALRASPETDFIPVILLTARADQDHRIAGLEGGADDYIVKPFDMRELKARAENLIATRKRLRERFRGSLPLELRPRAAAVSDSDAAFVARVRDAIAAHIDNGEFGVAELAHAVFQDRSHMYRRIQSLFGESPSDLIRRLRIERAAALLAEGSGSVAEVAYAAGFNSVAYFHRCFRDIHGVTPAAYRDEVMRRGSHRPART